MRPSVPSRVISQKVAVSVALFIPAAAAPQTGYGAFTYARSPTGILFEPERESKELFERWYAGETLF